MNQQQRKYARERVNGIFERKCSLLKEKHTKKGSYLSSEDKAALIRSGKIKLKRGCKEVHNYTDVVKVFDFSKYQKDDKFDSIKYEAEKNNLRKQMNKVIDEIMLGDAKEAIKLIEKFDS